jgi:lipid A disaccharide synthetase
MFNVRFFQGDAAKWRLFGEADVAIAASGTVLLELALSGVPHMSSYKLDPIARMLSDMVTTWTAALPNLRHRHIVTCGFARVELARTADALLGSSIISFHCAIQPTVRASANSTVNMVVGKPSAFSVMPE